MLCGERALLKSSSEAVEVKPLPCRSWSCEACAAWRQIDLRVQAQAGNPTTFLTLTVNPSVGLGATHRSKLLKNAFKILMKRVCRRLGVKGVAYMWVMEKTKLGEPHMHVLLRMPFVPQAWISDQMRDLIGAPIVDIRRVDDPAKAARYVAKYVAKEPAQFGTGKRYFATRDWEQAASEQTDEEAAWLSEGWHLAEQRTADLIHSYVSQGFHPELLPRGITRLWKPGHWSPADPAVSLDATAGG